MNRIVDFHYHIAQCENLPRSRAGCVISRSLAQNRVLAAAPFEVNVGRALHHGLNDLASAHILARQLGPHITVYIHFDVIGCDNLTTLAEQVPPTHFDRMPLVLHVSRHDHERFAAAKARRCLERARELWPNAKLLIAHLGGENFELATEWIRAEGTKSFLDTSCLDETCQRSGIRDRAALLAILSKKVSAAQIVYGSDDTIGTGPCNPLDANIWRESFGTAGAERILAGNASAFLADS